jgi:cephalosporin hydroxylase
MRFVKFKERNFFSIISYISSNFIDEYLSKIKDTKHQHFKWRELTLMKDPMSVSILMQLLQDLKPKTILEFGTFDGGSALYMEDVMKSIGQDCNIYTFDIDENNVKLPNNTKIKFYKLDNYKIKEFVVDNIDIFKNMERPVLIIEDSHHNVIELLNEVDSFLLDGDYIIVEDTTDKRKYDELSLFLEGKEYLVDTHYCDFWGYNNSWNFNSYLKKVDK